MVPGRQVPARGWPLPDILREPCGKSEYRPVFVGGEMSAPRGGWVGQRRRERSLLPPFIRIGPRCK